MDIKQGLSAVAAVTLGKDMTFRDYAQGAFRMRGIGKGQKVQVGKKNYEDYPFLIVSFSSEAP